MPEAPRPVRVALLVDDDGLRADVVDRLEGRPGLRRVDAEDDADVVISDLANAAERSAASGQPLVVLWPVRSSSWPPSGSVVRADVPGDLLEHVLRLAAEGYVVRPDPLAPLSVAAGSEPGLDRLDDMDAPTRGGSAPSLTPRESEVLALLADGASNKVIARRLGISPSTAKFHVASLLGKLGARSRLDAVAIGMRLGLVLV